MRRRSRTARLICALLLPAFAPALAVAQPLPGDGAIAQLDRAEALIAAQDASGRPAFAMLGVLTGPDRAALTAAITEAAELTDAASVAIDAAIAHLDAGADPDDATADRRFALAIERRELRLPLARARAATILAALQDDRRTRTALATTAVNALHKVTLSGVAIDTRGAVIAGEAMLLLGEHAKALASLDAVIAHAQRATESDRPSPMDVAEAMIGRSLAIAGLRGDHAARLALSDCRAQPPFVVDAAPSPLLSLLRADAAVRLDQLAGSSPPGISGYVDALANAPTEPVYRSLRRAIFDRLDTLWAMGAWTPASAPALATVARAEQLASDDATRTSGIGALERLLDRPESLSVIELAEARLALATIEAPTNPGPAMLLLLEIAGDAQPSMLAPTALRRAYAIGEAAASGGGRADLADPVTANFDRAIAMMIDRSASAAQRQALWLRRAALFESASATDKAILAYDRIPPDSDLYHRAQRRALSLAVGELLGEPAGGRAQAVLARVQTLEQSRPDPAMRELLLASRVLALTRLGRLAEATQAIERIDAATHEPEPITALAIDGCLAPLTGLILDAEIRGDTDAQRDAASLLLRTVESDRAIAMAPTPERRRARGLALLMTGRAGAAVSEFERLSSERHDPGIRVWLAESLLADGEDERAFASYRSVAEALGSRGETGDPDFWRSWSRMLEILSAPDGERADAEGILVQINRLALIDPAFGGQPHKRRIEAVVRAMKPIVE
jgi:hypothetical protein